MKIVQWLVANVIFLAVGLCGLAGALLVVIPAQVIDVPADWWPLVTLLSAAVAIAASIYGGGLVMRLVERIGNRGH